MKKTYNIDEESKQSNSQSKLSQYEDDDKSKRSGITGESDGDDDDEDVELAIKSSDLIVRFIWNDSNELNSSDLKATWEPGWRREARSTASTLMMRSLNSWETTSTHWMKMALGKLELMN
jgi:hypothetical protein